MKKILSLLLLLVAITAKAQLSGDGYYRISNVYTDRYVYIVDNTGSINLQTTTIETGAIELWMHIDRALYDPATVLFIEKHDNKYDIRSQSTGIYQMLGTYVSIYADPRNPGTYWAYGEKSGMVAYLWDDTASLIYDQSTMSNVENKQYPLCRNWYITPIDNSTDNYFGVKPTITAKGENYAIWYADFPFTFQSTGMNAYYVSKVDEARGLCVYKEATGTIPAQTPLFIKCKNTEPVNNKLSIGGNAAPISGNLLTGVFFNCKKSKHDNRVAYDTKTMRVLGVMKDGSLGMITANYDYMPRNSFYLKVSANAPAEMQLVTEAEYQEIINRPVEAESVTLNTTSLNLTVGGTANLTASVMPANTTDKTVTWSTSNAAVATVDAQGKVTAVSVGTTTISAKCGNVTATCTVTVNPVLAASVTLNATTLTLTIGETSALTATVAPDNTTDKTVTWSTSNAAVATVDAHGTVTAVTVGTATITAKCGEVSATCTVTVNPVEAASVTLNATSLALEEGQSASLTATVAPDNTTDKTVVWTTSDANVATVDQSGNVKAIAEGVTTITATCGKASATCTVTVSAKAPVVVILDKTELTLYVDEAHTLTATVLNSDEKHVTWTSDNSEVVAVDANGNLTAVSSGVATVKAACGDAYAQCIVTVNKYDQVITWDQTFENVHEGDVVELTAQASSSLEITYVIASEGKYTFDAGKLTILTPGTVTITAHQEGDRVYNPAVPVVKIFNAEAGINDVTGDLTAVSVVGNTIVVKGAAEGMAVYTIAGTLVYQGNDSSVTVAPNAMYIVKANSKVYKVYVK